MKLILRTFIALALLAVAGGGLIACGGDDDASSASVDDLLTQTFTGKKDVKSGRLALNVDLNIQGSGEMDGPIKVTLGGPFQSQGEGKLPIFDIDLSFEGAGQSIKAGATSTGSKGFVNFNGQEYAVSDEVFNQFKTAFEQASQQGGQNQSLQSLGLDPRSWITNATNAGEAKVGDTDTIKITGGVDVAKMIDDIFASLQKNAGQLGLQGQVPELTDEQRKQITDAVKDVKVEIYTGTDDKILRRMFVSLSLSDPTGQDQGSADVKFDLSLLDLNEDQEVSEPSNTKPFEELVQQLGGLGLGGLGGGGSSGSGGSGGGSSTENLEEYTKCLEEAGSDTQAAQACADLLTG